jgi:hypothetical protein
MVDIFLEYGYYMVGIGVAIFSIIVSYFSIKKYFHEMKIEQQTAIDKQINSGVNKVISAINEGKEITKEKFIRTDQAIQTNITATDDIKHDVEILENDFKSLCAKIGKHDYIVDQILPEYLDLKDSIYHFKHKIDDNLLTNNDDDRRNTDNVTGEENGDR